MQKLRILVVDDEPTITSAIRRSLDRQHDVTVTNRGSEAWELLAAGPPYDAIFCDILMPGMTGVELFRRVQAERPAQTERFLFLVGGVYSPDIEQFLAGLANPKIEKPFDPKDLQNVLASWGTPSAT